MAELRAELAGLEPKRESGVVGLSVAAITLVPYITVTLPFELAMRVQAALILLVLGGLLGVGWRGVRAWLSALPRAVRWGLGVWAVSAFFGAAVGWFSSNPPRYIVSQLVAMLLLPAAALAFGAQAGLAGQQVAGGLSIASVSALGIHLLALLLGRTPAQSQGEPLRFLLANDIGISGAAPLVLLCAASWWWATGAKLATAGVAASLILVVGSMSRGAWVISLGGLAATIALLGAHGVRARVRRAFVMVALGASLLFALVWVARPGELLWRLNGGASPGGRMPGVGFPARPSTSDRAVLAVPERVAGQEHILLSELAVEAPAVELTSLTLGPNGTSARLTVRGRDERGNVVFNSAGGIGGGGGWTRTDRVLLLPSRVRAVSVVFWTSGGDWHFSEVAVRAVDGTLRAWLRTVRGRLVGLSRLLDAPTGDANLLYRKNEAEALIQMWRAATPGRIVLGHGLGATFPFTNASFDERGQRIFLTTASYVHNFYLFLGFKLGLAGAVALAGIAILVLRAGSEAVHSHTLPRNDWMLATASVVFGAYLVWGVSAPEIINFRVAPLLGAVLATSLARGRNR